jgi:hypothetical protein
MDLYLPYHLGGWIDFSESNFSCIVEYILDPHCYLRNPESESHIPRIRKWARYCLLKARSGSGIFSKKARIAYRGTKLENPFKDPIVLRQTGPLKDYLYRYAGLEDPVEYMDSLDSLLNYRGLHNAKPRIKFALEMKNAAYRQKFFKNFRKIENNDFRILTKDVFSLSEVLYLSKSVPDAPSYFSYPRFLSIPGRAAQSGKKHQIMIYRKSDIEGRSLEHIRLAMASTVESIMSGGWYARSDPFIFHEIWTHKKTGYLLSNQKIVDYQAWHCKLPNLFRAFCPNKRLFWTELCTRTQSYPSGFKEYEISESEYQMYMFKDAFDLILPPDLKGKWRLIKVRHKKHLNIIRNILSGFNLTTRTMLKVALDTIEEVLQPQKSEEEEEVILHSPHDVRDFLERFEDESLYRRVIASEYTIEDLLDSESEDSLFYQDVSGSEMEVIDEGIEALIDDDSETEDDEPPLGTVRRLVRHFNQLTRNSAYGLINHD